MNSFLRRVTTSTAIVSMVGLAVSAVCFAAGGRVNTTKSIPVGLYWVSDTPPMKGQYVMFCPPSVAVFDEAKERGYIGAGFCPGGYGYMMKRILAAKGDMVSIQGEGVRVNGELLPLSVPFKADKAGRAMPHYEPNSFTVSDNEVLLMSDVSAISFDGRYFGPVLRSQIQGVIRPILIW